MAPRPIISQRCGNCRRRKKACDNKRPTCGLCLRVGAVCEPYTKRFVFVGGDAAAGNHQHPSRIRQGTKQACGESSLTLSMSSKAAMRSAVFFEFMFGYVPKDRMSKQRELELSAMTWMTTVADGQEDLAFMRYASGALGVKAVSIAAKANSTTGSNNRAEWDLESERLYGQAVCALHKASETVQKGQAQAFKMLSASVALILFELFNPTAICSERGCKSFAVGIGSLLQYMGPDAFCDSEYRNVLMHCRIILSFNAILMETQPFDFLNTKAWLQIPWRNSLKSDYQRAIDIILLIPNALQAANEITSRKTYQIDEQEILRFNALCGRIDNQLNKWYTDVTSRRGPLYTTTIQPNYLPDHILSQEYVFANLDDGQAMQVYWASKLFVHVAKFRVAHHTAYAHSSPISAPEICRLQAFATNTLRSFPQFLAVESGFVGLKYCIIPLKAVIIFYEQYGFDEELAVSKMYANQLRARGIEFCKFLYSRNENES